MINFSFILIKEMAEPTFPNFRYSNEQRNLTIKGRQTIPLGILPQTPVQRQGNLLFDPRTHFGAPLIEVPVIDEKSDKQATDPDTDKPVFEKKPAKDPLMIEDRDMIGVLLSCVKDLNTQVKTLQDENHNLKSQNQIFEERLAKLEKILAVFDVSNRSINNHNFLNINSQ
uniref:Uncharacterized protein n=1 Tax=Marseillevirus LCMAC101 TaxID=2506602 RepID=A0A481YRH8_9VIRU|nr:MAG: hypothetical protein LCMAC101_01650 [Marseillevirus LCMAC101]